MKNVSHNDIMTDLSRIKDRLEKERTTGELTVEEEVRIMFAQKHPLYNDERGRYRTGHTKEETTIVAADYPCSQQLYLGEDNRRPKITRLFLKEYV